HLDATGRREGEEMKTKPRGPRYRNLFARGATIYYERELRGQRIKFSCETNDWSAAAAVRDLYEQRKGIGRLPIPVLDTPRLAEFTARYLDEDTQHLAATKRRDRGIYLKPGGRVLGMLGERRLDEITPALLRTWGGREVNERQVSISTGRCYLDASRACSAMRRISGSSSRTRCRCSARRCDAAHARSAAEPSPRRGAM